MSRVLSLPSHANSIAVPTVASDSGSGSDIDAWDHGRNSQRTLSSRKYRQLSISPSPHPAARLPTAEKKQDDKVTWSTLPRKGQLGILFLARLAEPLTQTSLQSYLYYQLAHFDPSLPPSRIAGQAGILIASFAAAQACTSVLWGTVSDAPWGGRKLVIIVGLLGTGVGSLGYGFAGSWGVATLWRILSGSLNGNVGVMRTMISEIVKEKKYQSRAFLLMPLCFNIGVVVGPVLGGFLADPIGNFPGLFGPNSTFGGKDGVWWMARWPYAPPNTLSAVYLFTTAIMVFFFLEETHVSLQDKPDLGIKIGRSFVRLVECISRRRTHDYTSIGDMDVETPGHSSQRPDIEEQDLELAPPTPATPLDAPSPAKSSSKTKPRAVLPFRRIWTPNVIIILCSSFLMAMGVGSFNSLWFIFLSTPRFDPAHPIPKDHSTQSPPFFFTGGLGLLPTSVGLAMAILGGIGITLQFLIYPTVSDHLGTLRSYQLALLLFPVVYALTPYLVLVPSITEPPKPASGGLVWSAICALLFLQVVARTFVLPSQIILINNSSPHPSRLGTLHGVAQSVSSAARTLGPMIWSSILGFGLSRGVVGLAYWGMAIFAAAGAVVAQFVEEGSGHEIVLEEDEEI